MPEQNEPVDVFNFDAAPPSHTATAAAPAEAPPSIKAGPKPAVPKREGGIKQWHILVGVGVILVGGIVLTSLPSGHTSSSAPSGVLQPQAAMSSAAERAPSGKLDPQSVTASSLPEITDPPAAAPPASAPNAPQPSTATATVAATNPATATTAAPPAIAQAAPQASNAAALADLTTQVGATQISVQQLAVEVAKLTKALDTKPAAARSRAAARPAQHSASRTTPRSEAVIRSLSGVPYTINTIGRGYAWLQAGDHVEIVQPGDRIGTTRVLAVDARERRVITSDGIIK